MAHLKSNFANVQQLAFSDLNTVRLAASRAAESLNGFTRAPERSWDLPWLLAARGCRLPTALQRPVAGRHPQTFRDRWSEPRRASSRQTSRVNASAAIVPELGQHP